MGKGQTKGRKGHKGKARPAGNKGRAHTEEAWRHAQQVNARRKAEGKDARSTASISRSQRRAQQHHLAKAKAKPEAESSRARSRSPLRRGASSRSPAAEVAQRSPSYSEEPEEGSTGPGGAGARDDPPPLQPAAAAKATGEILPEQKYKGQCATTAGQVQVKGELLPEAGRPEDDTVQGGQSAGSGESLPAQRKATAQADTLGVASEPCKRAMAEHGKLESAQDAGGGRLVDVTGGPCLERRAPHQRSQDVDAFAISVGHDALQGPQVIVLQVQIFIFHRKFSNLHDEKISALSPGQALQELGKNFSCGHTCYGNIL